MIGIKDTLELNATLHGKNDRLADRIMGIGKTPHRHTRPFKVADPVPSPLRRYTRHTISGLPGGIGNAFGRVHANNTRRYAA